MLRAMSCVSSVTDEVRQGSTVRRCDEVEQVHVLSCLSFSKLQNEEQLDRELDFSAHIRRRTGRMADLHSSVEGVRPNPTRTLGAALAPSGRNAHAEEFTELILPASSRDVDVPVTATPSTMIIRHLDAMRTFGSYKNSRSGSARKTDYSNREATEWDVRLDVSSLLPALS